MEIEQELLSTEILNRGTQDTGPYAGSPSFTVRVRRGLPDFLGSVNLKYVKLGYTYLLGNGLYLLTLPLLVLVFSIEIGKLTWVDYFFPGCYYPLEALFLLGVSVFILYVYLDLSPRSTYVVDFACFRPPNELKISKEEYIELAQNSGNFNKAAIDFQQRMLKNSGIGDQTYLPRTIFRPGYKINLNDGRAEAKTVIFGAIDALLATTKIRVQDIKILVVNCGVLNTTPSLSAMVINHYKLRHNIESYNLGGMGCAAGIVAVDLAKDLMNAHPGSYALVVSTEVVSYTWYTGNQPDMLFPNCFFRMGAAAVLMSSRRMDRWRAKYELKQLVRTHMAMDDKSFKSIKLDEDSAGKQGVSVSRDVIEVGGNALKANITTLGPLVLPVSEQAHFFSNLFFRLSKQTKRRPYIPNYKLAFEHVCIQATSKRVLDEIQKNLQLTDEYMEASRRTLERFGNTSSSSVWYELAYLEDRGRVKRGDRVWQIGFGSGFKCNSVVWKALRTIRNPRRQNSNPWFDDHE